MSSSRFVFFNDTATTEIYTLSLHDALPICQPFRPTRTITNSSGGRPIVPSSQLLLGYVVCGKTRDRKSTRLNSSHANISYAVFCLKKKKMADTIYVCAQLQHSCGCKGKALG